MEDQGSRWGLVAHACVTGNCAYTTLLWSIKSQWHIYAGAIPWHLAAAYTWMLWMIVSTVLMAWNLLLLYITISIVFASIISLIIVVNSHIVGSHWFLDSISF